MSILPASSTFDSLGGTIADYSEIVDPTTDLPSSADNESRANVAAMSRTVGRVWFDWTNDGSIATIAAFDSVVGNSSTNHPVYAKQDTGHWRFTFPASVTDTMGNSQAWNFKSAKGSASHNEPIHVQCKVVTPNVIDVFMWLLPAATANDVSAVSIHIEVL